MPRRGFTLIAVLVIVGSTLLVATSLIFVAQADVAGAAHVRHSVQSRALIDSGIEVVMQRLNEQRDLILEGRLPELEDQYEIYEAGSTLGVVRLLPVTPGRDRLDPQAAKLDVNAKNLTEEMLTQTGWIEPDLAAAILARRSQMPGGMFHSVGDLLSVPGMTPELLFGPLEDMIVDETDFAEGDLVERVSERFTADQPRGITDVLTVFAVEPELQRDGVRRINLNVPWSEQLGVQLDERFGEGAGAMVKAIIDDGTDFGSDEAIFGVLLRFDVDPNDWPDILDALTTSEGDYRFGRVDINSASEEALLALPGMQPEQAAELIRVREGLSPQELSTIAWPLLRGIVEAEAYEQLGPWLTTRSWTYRVVLAAGEVEADEPQGELRNPAVFEVIIDLAAPRPRVAYLRDITMARTAAVLFMEEQSSNPMSADWYEDGQARLEDRPVAEEDALSFPDATDWPDEEESWPMDDLADETIDADDDAAASSQPIEVRQRLGRWRSE